MKTSGGARILWVLLALALVGAGCSKKLATPNGSPAAGGGNTFTAGDGDDGISFTLHPGDHLVVTLSSTTWTFQTPTGTVLQAGSVTVASPSADCLPNEGCGSVTADFTALSPGTTQVVATRTDCGEGQGCSGDAGHYGITVVVTANGAAAPSDGTGVSPAAQGASAQPSPAQPTPTRPAASPAASPIAPPGGSPSPGPGAAVTASDANDGQVVILHMGDHLKVTLASTYWSIHPLPDATVLIALAAPQIQPSPGCVPGQGCGTVTQEYLAGGLGQVQIAASRTTCGEALACTGTQGSFSLTVQVTGQN